MTQVQEKLASDGSNMTNTIFSCAPVAILSNVHLKRDLWYILFFIVLLLFFSTSTLKEPYLTEEG